MEKAFSLVPGILETESGYANGDEHLIPDYMLVCSGKFRYCEAVRIVYDPDVITLTKLLDVFFMVIDPTLLNRQGNDKGIQYRTGIFWTDEGSGRIVEEYVRKEREKHDEFFTEIGPLKNFFTAEEYHQDYLDKNPNGYCHIPSQELDHIRDMFSHDSK